MIEVGQGNKPTLQKPLEMQEADVDNINSYYATLLTTDEESPRTALDATIDELLDCLQPDNAVERIAYRKQVGTAHGRDFVKLNQGEMGQANE